MQKKFLTYNQQMKCLREKNIECNGSMSKTILCRQGYFNIINGYKVPFTCGKDIDGSNKYINGTSIFHFSKLKFFDEEIRYLLLKYITKAEEEVRTFVSYKFDLLNNKGSDSWYEISAYDNTKNPSDLIGLISKIYTEINQSKQDYVKFYLEKHKSIPTWIAIKSINFSTFINMIDYSKKGLKDAICNLYGFVDETGHPDYKLLLGSLHWMRLIRNICAHNERVYCIKRLDGRIKGSIIKSLGNRYSNERSQKIIDLIIYLSYYLDKQDMSKLIDTIKNLLKDLRDSIVNPAFDNVRAAMGIKQIQDLDLILSFCKEKKYNNFS